MKRPGPHLPERKGDQGRASTELRGCVGRWAWGCARVTAVGRRHWKRPPGPRDVGGGGVQHGRGMGGGAPWVQREQHHSTTAEPTGTRGGGGGVLPLAVRAPPPPPLLPLPLPPTEGFCW